jgi:hypothetical protein
MSPYLILQSRGGLSAVTCHVICPENYVLPLNHVGNHRNDTSNSPGLHHYNQP